MTVVIHTMECHGAIKKVRLLYRYGYESLSKREVKALCTGRDWKCVHSTYRPRALLWAREVNTADHVHSTPTFSWKPLSESWRNYYHQSQGLGVGLGDEEVTTGL